MYSLFRYNIGIIIIGMILDLCKNRIDVIIIIVILLLYYYNIIL